MNFLNHGRKWARLWFEIYEKIKIEKKINKCKKEGKLLNIMVVNFLYTNSKVNPSIRNLVGILEIFKFE